MRAIKKIRLGSFAKEELKNQELGKILGGENCCICPCNAREIFASNQEGAGCYARDENDNPGYGCGAFSPTNFL